MNAIPQNGYSIIDSPSTGCSCCVLLSLRNFIMNVIHECSPTKMTQYLPCHFNTANSHVFSSVSHNMYSFFFLTLSLPTKKKSKKREG